MNVQHLASLCTLAAIVAVVAVGRGLRRRGIDDRLLRLSALAAAIPGWLFMQLGYVRYAWDPVDAAPLHVCDLGGIVAMFVLLSRGGSHLRGWRAVLFFWGFGLTTQAFATPVLTAEQGPHTVRFWLFWVSHGFVVGTAAYDLVVRGFRPRRADLFRGVAVTAAWLAAVFTLNVLPEGGWNYGYVGPVDDQPGVVALLGPWPMRVAWMALIVLIGFVLLWAIASRLPGGENEPRPRPDPSEGGGGQTSDAPR